MFKRVITAALIVLAAGFIVTFSAEKLPEIADRSNDTPTTVHLAR